MKRLIQAAQLLLANEILSEELASELDNALDWTDIIEIANKADKKYLPAIEDWYLYSSHNNDGYGLIMFATKVNGANIPEIQKFFIKNISDPSEILDFAEKVPGASIPALQEALFNTHDLYPRYILEFAKNVKGADLLKLEDKLIHNEDTSAKDVVEFAALPGVNIKDLQAALLKMDNEELSLENLIDFYKIKGANKKEIENYIKEKKGDKIYERLFGKRPTQASTVLAGKSLLLMKDMGYDTDALVAEAFSKLQENISKEHAEYKEIEGHEDYKNLIVSAINRAIIRAWTKAGLPTPSLEGINGIEGPSKLLIHELYHLILDPDFNIEAGYSSGHSDLESDMEEMCSRIMQHANDEENTKGYYELFTDSFGAGFIARPFETVEEFIKWLTNSTITNPSLNSIRNSAIVKINAAYKNNMKDKIDEKNAVGINKIFVDEIFNKYDAWKQVMTVEREDLWKRFNLNLKNELGKLTKSVSKNTKKASTVLADSLQNTNTAELVGLAEKDPTRIAEIEKELLRRKYVSPKDLLIVMDLQHEHNVDTKLIQQLFLSQQNLKPVDFLVFARHAEGSNIDLAQSLMLKNPETYGDILYDFAKDVKGANIPALEAALIANHGNKHTVAMDLVMFGAYIKGANIAALQKALLSGQFKQTDQYALNEFATLPGADIASILAYIKKHMPSSDYDRTVQDLKGIITHLDPAQQAFVKSLP